MKFFKGYLLVLLCLLFNIAHADVTPTTCNELPTSIGGYNIQWSYYSDTNWHACWQAPGTSDKCVPMIGHWDVNPPGNYFTYIFDKYSNDDSSGGYGKDFSTLAEAKRHLHSTTFINAYKSCKNLHGVK